MKSNYYDNVMKHLREITSQQDLQKIIGEWQGIGSEVEKEYTEYLDLEIEMKNIREEKEKLERGLVQRSEKDTGDYST